jgi:PAS domain S-box-containing protein
MSFLSGLFPATRQYRLSYRLLVYVVLCSSLFALLATATQLYVDYRRDVSALYESLQFIERSHLQAIATSVFKIDSEQLELQLEGMLKLPDMVYVEVRESRGNRVVFTAKGNPGARETVNREFPLDYTSPSGEKRRIGTLVAIASLEGVYQRLWTRVFTILATNTVKTFLASSCILVIIYLLITRYLTQMANYTQQLDPGARDRRLILNRRSSGSDMPDELEHLATAINNLQERAAQNIAQRRHAEAELMEQLRFEETLSALSARFVNLPPDQVDQKIERELEWIGEVLNVERVTVFEFSENNRRMHLMQSFTMPDIESAPSQLDLDQLTWAAQRVLKGEVIVFSHFDDLPEEAGREKDYFHAVGVQSAVVIPLQAGGATLGVLTLATLRYQKEWPDELIRRFGLVAEVLASALMRKGAEEKLIQAEMKYRTVADFTYNWEYWVNFDGSLEYVSPSCERISGYTVQDFLDNPSLFREIIVPEDRETWDNHFRDSRKELKPREIQFRIQRRDGEIRWIEHACQPITNSQGNRSGFRASNRDITKRKQSELQIRQAHCEIKQLKEQLEAESIYLQEEIKLEHNFGNIIGNSDALKYVLHRVEQVAATDATVLILGETGTGKELVARAIHSTSQRNPRPLVKVNCAVLPANLIESELFGHEKGAFTGALRKKIGRFELAAGTTLFLDEVGELPLELQAKLLRAIEEGEFERLGGLETIKVNARIISATNRNLEKEMQAGSFRNDLWYRLNVYPITLPPLRERTQDIPLLVGHFIKQFTRRSGKRIEKIPSELIKTLQRYSWPGNVRELKHVIERAVINTSGTTLQLADKLKDSSRVKLVGENGNKTLAEMERDYILHVLEGANWRIEGERGAAEILDINPGTLRSRMKKLAIHRPVKHISN